MCTAVFAFQLILHLESHWNLISFFTTVAASSVGWTQAKRHEELQATYQLADDELIEIKESRITTAGTEAEFVEAIVSGEGAISREHTVWRAKCGVSPKRRIRPNGVR
jgi:membrane protein implicated in regulation of membrane protease activity